MVYGRARIAQSAQQTVGKYLVVFGYQNAHGCLLLLWGCAVVLQVCPVLAILVAGLAVLRLGTHR
jgi:hypothetical protein